MKPSTTMLTDKLSQIIRTCWADFQKLKDLKTTVRPSIPILWFGNLEKYRNSPVRILTVALNPSNKEFSKDRDGSYQVGLRFPAAADLVGKDKLDDSGVAAYCKAMNEYFEKEPYALWFDNFEKPLNVLNATYYDSKETQFANRAVHIDLMTPIATNPTWGKLCQDQKQELYLESSKYFEALMEEFDPQIFLISVRREYIQRWLKVNLHAGNIVPQLLENNRLMIAGRNARAPFRGPGMTDAYVRGRMHEIKESYNLCVGESVIVQQTKDGGCRDEQAQPKRSASVTTSGSRLPKASNRGKNDRTESDCIDGENLHKLERWHGNLRQCQHDGKSLPKNVCMVEAFLFCSNNLKRESVPKVELNKRYCQLSGQDREPGYTSYCTPNPKYNAWLFKSNCDSLVLRERARAELIRIGWTTSSDAV